ncbi:MAG: hypothetical protein J4G03_06720 [Gemmatimonadetes bacterium]|nr:hypothetical protein [Gemmatimonadota bacterium]
MWSEQPGQDTPLGRLEHAGESWRVRVVVEAVSGGLAQGIISFRLGDERHDTAPVIIESSPSMVLQRAGQLPPPMLEQMLVQLLRSAGR